MLFTIFVLFHGLFRLYRAYEQALTIAPSPQVPAPWSAVVMGLLVFPIPIVLASLTEQLNVRSVERGYAPLSPKLVFVLCLLFFPIAFAMVQNSLNRFVERS